MRKTIVILLTIFLIGSIGIILFFKKSIQKRTQKITNFEECEKAGYPIAESYPPTCKTPDSKSFTQNIGNEIEKKDLIQVTSPRPNGTIKSPLIITGKARGAWFFEARFPIKLMDEKNNEISTGIAQAKGEWMTESFVPFQAELTFTTNSKEGILVLQKDNPSGLRENDDELRIPVKFR